MFARWTETRLQMSDNVALELLDMSWCICLWANSVNHVMTSPGGKKNVVIAGVISRWGGEKKKNHPSTISSLFLHIFRRLTDTDRWSSTSGSRGRNFSGEANSSRSYKNMQKLSGERSQKWLIGFKMLLRPSTETNSYYRMAEQTVVKGKWRSTWDFCGWIT